MVANSLLTTMQRACTLMKEINTHQMTHCVITNGTDSKTIGELLRLVAVINEHISALDPKVTDPEYFTTNMILQRGVDEYIARAILP